MILYYSLDIPLNVWPLVVFLLINCNHWDCALLQLRVFAHNIVESSEVTSGITKLGDYELHDLVALE